MEHVTADARTLTYTLQTVLNSAWFYVSDGCSLIRNTDAHIENAGFRTTDFKHTWANLWLLPIRPHIIGTATK